MTRNEWSKLLTPVFDALCEDGAGDNDPIWDSFGSFVEAGLEYIQTRDNMEQYAHLMETGNAE